MGLQERKRLSMAVPHASITSEKKRTCWCTRTRLRRSNSVPVKSKCRNIGMSHSSPGISVCLRMAGPFYLDTGQISHFITYLLIIYLPSIIIMLLHLQSRRFLMTTILPRTSFLPQGHWACIHQRCKVKWKMKRQHHVNTTRQKLRAHLFAFALASLKVG